MGAAQASDTIFSVLARAHDRGDKKSSPEALEELRATVKKNYEEQTDIRYGAARGWWTRSFNRTKHVKSSPSCCNTFPVQCQRHDSIPVSCKSNDRLHPQPRIRRRSRDSSP